MLLGQKIKELRLENGVLQRQLASLLDIDTLCFQKMKEEIDVQNTTKYFK